MWAGHPEDDQHYNNKTNQSVNHVAIFRYALRLTAETRPDYLQSFVDWVSSDS